ncbi:MAG: ABC transporter permease [Lewinellaceae bacterium]|nr:ABC transporter permease [Lewinellaceae bacterium]
MFQNYIKSAFRSLLRDKTSAAINIFGLTFALAGVLFILFFIKSELSTDSFHPHAGRLYRLTQQATRNGQSIPLATTPPPMGPAIEKELPEIEKTVRLRYSDDSRLSYGGQAYYEEGLWYADSAFFQLFGFQLALGDPASALNEPNTAVITPELALKYFGDENPLGKALLLGDDTPLKITGVLKESPRHSHLTFNLLASFSTFRVPPGYPVDMNSWAWGGFLTYVLLKEDATFAEVEEKLPSFIASKYEPELAAVTELHLQSMHDCYFNSGGMYGVNRNRTGNLAYVRGLGIVAVLILLVAAFNFTNLSLARGVRRAKEVGLRKVLGANQSGLALLFLSEAVLLSAIALCGGVILFFTGKELLEGRLNWDMDIQPSGLLFYLPVFAGLILLTGLAAGWFPAYLFSKNKAVQALKGEVKTGTAGNNLRRWLVGAQFFMMTTLIAGAFIVKQQMDFMQNTDLGFDREQVVALQLLDERFPEYYPRVRQRLLQNPNVVSVSAGDAFSGNNGSQPIMQPGVETQEATQMDILGAYFGYFETIGVEMAEGREFLETFPNDTTTGVILNETAVRKLGWEQPIGQRIQVGDLKPDGVVVGVVKDFHYRSLHEPIKPLAIFVPAVMSQVIVRLRPGDAASAIASLRNDWEAILPNLPFDLQLLDERLQHRYIADRSFSWLVYLFTGFTLAIAALGLYGLASILLGFRVREIGIRKVLGASVSGIVSLLSMEFLKLVFAACVAATPVAYYFMDKWLQDFAYRIDIQWWVFALAGVVAVGVAFLTVSFQSVKAALANPVESLRND